MTAPVIRLEIEAMKYEVVHYLGTHHEEIREAVEAAVTRALNDYDIDRHAYEEAMRVLDGVVKDAAKSSISNVVAQVVKQRFLEAFPEAKYGSPEWKTANGYGPE